MQLAHRKAHRAVWTALAVLLPLFLLAALTRTPAPFKPPLRLAPPAEAAKP